MEREKEYKKIFEDFGKLSSIGKFTLLFALVVGLLMESKGQDKTVELLKKTIKMYD